MILADIFGIGGFLTTAFNWVAGILHDIWCVITNLDKFVLYGLIVAFNSVISTLAFLINGLLAVLPDLPDPPDWGGTELPGGASISDVLGWVNFIIPVPTILEIFATVGATFFLVYSVAIILRWAKVMT